MSQVRTVVLLLLILLTAVQTARADTPVTESTATVPQPTLDFDFFADTTAETQARIAALPPPEESAKRRKILKAHQAFGLTTLGLLAASSVVGQLNYNDTYGAKPAGTGNYLWPHRALTYTATLTFGATATLALAAPNKPEERGFDTTTAHKLAVGGASLGMLSQVALGFATARYAGAGHPRDLSKMARAHQIIGYTTTGLLAVAATVWVF